MNCNRFTSLCKNQTYSTPRLLMHERAKIVSRHFLDLTSSVEVGDRSTIAGAYSQCWTHGFLYGNKKRARLDGDIVIGNDCYIGASCILLGGITIGDNITLEQVQYAQNQLTNQNYMFRHHLDPFLLMLMRGSILLVILLLF